MHQQQLHDASKKQMSKDLTAQRGCNNVLSRAVVRMTRAVAEIKVDHNLTSVLPYSMTVVLRFRGAVCMSCCKPLCCCFTC